ncbi:4115_t:CDS:10 [Paraglomus occultum]|uniref:4115_t:CDS:1 n=1 Tax=Paraglomus occultum TaxID=144539 RepID=A0A9N9FDX0_9GLOM|nr:4115_t:CDS:10 [Paraglomus occultum]
MDKIKFKLLRLETLWEEFRRENDGDDYGNQSEWAKKQLEGIERELEATLREASMWKERLRAEIEDLLLNIHEMFHLFGRQSENTVLEAAGLPIAFNAKTRDRLQSLHDSLSEEINVTRNNLKLWIEGIKQIVKELGAAELDLSIEDFENDLSTAAVQPIWFKYDALNRLISTRRDMFEDSAIKLHFYWTAFSYAPVDDIDHALAKLFEDKPSLMDALNNSSNADKQASGTTNEKEDQVTVNNEIQKGDISVSINANAAHSSYTLPVTSKATITSQISTSTSSLSTSAISTTSSSSSSSTPSERYTYFSTPYTTPPIPTYTYYSTSLPSGLFLSEEQLEALQNKVTFFERDYVERRDRRDVMVKTITALWEELNVPEDDRRVIVRNSVEEEYLNELSAEHERLRALMREIVQKAIEEYTAQLEDLWDKCLVPQSERAEFIVNLHEISSSEEVYHVLASEVARLQELYAKCAEIYRLMLERKSLIEKMIDFEKHASDPKRLFQSSFRLLEEEKWRKTCWPNLVRLEKRLVDACLEYETNERKPFMHEGKRYLEGLEEEISERVVNKMFFGFEHGGKTPAERNQARSRNISRPSAPVSPATSRPSSPTRASRRGSMYVEAKTDTNGARPQRGISPSGRQSRRPSVAIPNGNEARTNTPSQSRRSSMYLDPNSAIRRPKRSSSVSSNSSTSSISSVSTPTSVTPDPRSVASALKKAGLGNNSTLKPTRASSIPVRPHTPAGKDKPQRRQTTNVVNGSRPRPKSVIVTDSGNGLMGKKLINTKRMSVVSER